MCKIILVTLALLIPASAIDAADPDEIAAITATALDYMEGWYQGDAKRMKASLHPKLAKRSLEARSGGKRALRRSSASDMVAYTQHGYGVGLWQESYTIEVKVLDVFKDIATAIVVAPHYMEYLHLAKTGERWVIVNTLYEKKSPANN